MQRKSTIVVSLFILILLFILALFIFNLLIFGRLQGQILAASLIKLLASSSMIVVSSASPAHIANQGSATDWIGALITVIVAIIGAVGLIGAAFVTRGYIFQLRGNGRNPIDTEVDIEPRNSKECADYYRRRLLKDQTVTTVQILSMDRPLQITRMVQLRLSQQEMSLEELHLETNGDPFILLPQRNPLSSNRVRRAMEPATAIGAYNKRCVIVGDPGSGKTTLLKYFVVQSASKKLPGLPDLPIYIELNKFASSGNGNLLDYAASNWKERYNIPLKHARQCIKENLRDGNVLLLLDALNEAVTGESFEDADASYKRVVSAIERIGVGNEAPIIVTTRKADYRQRPLQNGFTKLEVLDFMPEDIREFVNRWFADHHDQYKRESATELNSIIERNPRIQALARNPLLLTEIAIVYEEKLQLPQGRAKLYRECVDILLERWNAVHNAQRPRQFTLENKKNLLEEIAWYFHLQGRRYFPADELLRIIEDFLPAMNLEPEQNSRILNAIASESGLLKEYARGWYGFLHVTMQEFYVAQQIHEQDKVDILLKYCDELWWEEVLLLHAAYSRDASPLLQSLLERGIKLGVQKDIFYTNLLLAGRCLATHAPVRKIQLREEIVTALFDVLLTTQYSLSRQQVVEILAEIGGTRVNERLLAILSDKNTPVNIQIAIVEALGRVGEQSLGPRLFTILDENSVVRDEVHKHVASALGKMGGRFMARSLLLYLQRPTIDEEVGGIVADALSKLGASGKLEEEDKIASDLFQLLSRKQINPYIRGRIAFALGRFGNRSLAPGLAGLLPEEGIEVLVRMRIVDALGTLGDPSVVDALERQLSNPRLDQGLCMSIVDTLGALGECNDVYKPHIIHKLQEILLRQSEHPDVRGHAAIALGMLGDQSEAEIMLRLLLQPSIDTFLSQSIVIALGRLAKRSTVSQLSQTISTQLLEVLFSPKTDSGVRIRVADFMGMLGDRIQTSLTSEMLNILIDFSVDARVRQAVVNALGRLGEQAVAASLFRLLSYPNVELNTCGHIVYVLCLLCYENVFPVVLKFLAEENLDLQIRWLIADSLSALGEKIQPSDIIPLLAKTEIHPSVRRHVAGVLAQIVNDEASVLELASLLPSSDIADDIHRILWVVSRRVGVRIVMRGQEPETIRWRDKFAG